CANVGAVHHERFSPEVGDLPELMDFWTVREYVFLARLLRAAKDSSAVEVERLDEVLALLDELEQTEAIGVAREWSSGPMAEQDSRKFQSSVLGRAFSVFIRDNGSEQQKLIEQACTKPDAKKLEELLTGDCRSINSLMTRTDGGFSSHPKCACWPLRMYIYARQSVEEDHDILARLWQTLEIVNEFEREMVESIADTAEMLTPAQRANLCVLLGMPNFRICDPA
ncbi:unnamed protein product, partial [Effrenium voratum]